MTLCQKIDSAFCLYLAHCDRAKARTTGFRAYRIERDRIRAAYDRLCTRYIAARAA